MTCMDRLVRWMLHPVSVLLMMLILVLSYLYLDKPIAIYFHQLDLRHSFHILSMLTVLGKWQIYVLLFFLMAAAGEYFKIESLWRHRLWFLFLCAFVPNLICLVLKICLGRARPDLFFESQLYGFYWFKFQKNYWSFPSGHTTTIMSMAAGFSILWPRYLIYFFIFGLMIVSTRVLLYHHYLSDVLSAFYLTIITVGLMKDWLKSRKLLTF